MKRILTVLLAAGTLAGAAVATSAPAEARWRGGWAGALAALRQAPSSAARWHLRTTIPTATMAITRRIPIRRLAFGGGSGTAMLGFAAVSDDRASQVG